ncbi:SusC/RagA family TonB-linked outer membrane protein [Parapedobacter pyrenivorans]|uniref:SusC/RagA family TonB-linked outer membrane protein n=1 Tax=Parapedobacter pyrenivorans TaxID=1305674 RepID=UPI003340F79A
MKLTSLMLLVLFLHVGAETRSQTVSLNVSRESIGKVFETIESQTDYTIVFNDRFVDPNTPITIKLNNVTLLKALEALLEPIALSYNITEKTIVITASANDEKKKAGIPRGWETQQRTVSGRVTDERGEPLEGATVKVNEGNQMVPTDAGGNFSLTIRGNAKMLIFSILGYQEQRVVLGSENVVNVSLTPESNQLEEVVIGYGRQQRKDITGAVSSISESEIKNLVLTSPDQALQGRAAGVQMTQSSSAPGGNASIRIRGGNSLSAGNEPLYVIDGFPVYNDNSQYSTGALNNGQPANVLASINPSDIASIEILKDASATAIYGSRGANGVVIITTKRGKAGRSDVNFESYFGIQRVRYKIPLLGASDFAVLANEQERQLGRPEPYPNPESYGKGTDWQDAGFQTAPVQNYQLAFNGGDQNTQYAISGNYFGQTGIIRGSNLQRGSIRINLDRKVSEKIKIGTSFNASRTANNQITADTDPASNITIGSVTALLTTPPTEPVYDENGDYHRFFGNDGNFVINPIARLDRVNNLVKTNRILGNVFGEYEIIDGLTAKISLGADQISLKEDYYNPASIQDEGVDAVARQGFINSFSWLNENTLTYQRRFGDRHDFTGLLGFTRQAFSRESAQAGAQRFVNDILEQNSLNSGALTLPPQSGRDDWALESYISRINYGYDGRFLVTLTGRIDGSSRFGADNKYSFFPSGSFAWRLSEEQFMNSVRGVDDLKLRVSYGVTGNQEIPRYRSLAALGNNNYPVAGLINSGLAPTRVANPNLRWESTAQFDVGLDASFFNERLQVTTDFYHKRTFDLLLDVAIPGSSGFTSALQNTGSVQNKGVEFALNTVNIDRALKWETSFNITFNRNKVLDLGDDIERPAGQASPGRQIPYSGILRVGEPVGIFYGYLTDGLFQTQEELDASIQPNVELGDRRYKDVNQDGVLDGDDRAILGYAQPDFFYGFTNNVSYKGFDLSVFFQGVQGNSVLNLNLNAETNINVPGALDRWTPTNTDTDVPRSALASRITNKQVEDGSFLRLRNVTLGYNLPQSISPFFRSVRIYVSGQNLLTFTSYTGFDPEVNAFGQDNLSIGVDRGSYPASKTVMFGLNIGI